LATTLPGVLGKERPSFGAKHEQITEIDTLTAGCFDYDELSDYLQRNVYGGE
jgi:hypothetical protein